MIIGVLLFMGICGTICIVSAIYKIILREKCTQKVMAQYTTRQAHVNLGSSLPTTYTPYFTYHWEGREYRAAAFGLNLSKKKIMEFHSDRQYEVYIDPKKPKRLILTKKVTVTEITDWITGAGCYFLAMVVLFLLFVEMWES